MIPGVTRRPWFGQNIWPDHGLTTYAESMATTKPIHEVKDQLSRVIADIEATGEEVRITRHGRVVAVLGPPPPDGIVFGAGVREGLIAPGLDDLEWSADDLDELIEGPVEPT